MPHIVKITNELLNEASEHSTKRMSFEYNRFKLADEVRKSMILIGTIGQLVFKHYLDSKDISYKFEYQAGEYDNFDFLIQNDIFEIKTSGYDDYYNYLNLLYSDDQYQRGKYKDYKYCVQIFINGYNRNKRILEISKCNKAIIYGVILFNEIQKYKNPHKKYFGDDYKVPLNELIEIDEVLNNYGKNNDKKRHYK